MKKLISILLTFAFVFVSMTGCSAAELEKSSQFVLTMQIGNPVMTVNGEEKNIDENGTVPVIENDRTLVPIRAIIEAMGGSVLWDSETNTAVLTLGRDKITLNIGSETAFFNEEKHTLDVAPKIINDRTMLPIRFIAESFKFAVDWDEKTETITITKDFADVADNSEATTPDTSKGGKTLVVYYSASGSTAKVAEYIKNAANADIFELEPVDKYSDADLNWTNSSSRVNAEHEDESKRDIELVSTTVPNWEDYDTVFIGYPIWWGDMPMILYTFFESYDFSGKTIITFNTHGGSGFSNTVSTIRSLEPDATVVEGLSISRNHIQDAKDEIVEWVNGL